MINALVLGSAEAFFIMLRMSHDLKAINISKDIKTSMFAYELH